MIDRPGLLYGVRHDELLGRVSADTASVSPATKVISHMLPIGDPRDFKDVYANLFDFAHLYQFDPDSEEY